MKCFIVTIVAVEKIIFNYSECMSTALDIQDLKRMLRIILPSVACSAVQYFSTLSHKG
jgi:hypothetical protein